LKSDAGAPNETLSRHRKRNPARMAVKQGSAEPILKIADAPTYRGLLNIQKHRGLAKATLF
jgi:hypothetical protein